MDGWAKIKSGSKYADVGERSFRDWLKNGLRHTRLNSKTILIKYSWIDEYLEKFEVEENRIDRTVDDALKDF